MVLKVQALFLQACEYRSHDIFSEKLGKSFPSTDLVGISTTGELAQVQRCTTRQNLPEVVSYFQIHMLVRFLLLPIVLPHCKMKTRRNASTFSENQT